MTTKLSPYFMLCPITDLSKLQGVAEHPETDCVLVTSSRNMISRYKMAEQRPLSSWSSRETMKGPVLYDKPSSRYVSLLASNQLRVWSETDLKLEQMKKLTFPSKMWGLVPGPNGQIYVVFENGRTLPLQGAMDARKEPAQPVLTSGTLVTKCFIEQIQGKCYVLFICHKKNQSKKYINIQELKEEEMITIKEVDLINDDYDLSGLTVCIRKSKLTLLSLWSDGQLLSLPLLEPIEAGDLGHVEGRVEGVMATKKVALACLSDNHVAVYGADTNEEGATLTIFNTQFKLVQSRQRLKLYTSPPQMWGPFSSQLLLASGGHLLAAPFQLGHETLASMVGSANKRKVTASEVHHLSWGSGKISEDIPHYPHAPDSIREAMNLMARQGFSEAAMSQKILPTLLEKKDALSLLWFLESVHDIPESVLARLISFSLRENDATFSALATSPRPEVDEQDTESTAILPPDSPLGGGRLTLLDSVLAVPFNSTCLLPELRRHLAPQDAMLLLRHVAARLWHGDEPNENTEAQITQMVQWSSIMLDANYQHCLLSMDTDVLHTLTTLSDIVDTQIKNIEELRNLEPIIKRMQEGRHLPKPKEEDHTYSIEIIQLCKFN